jgi:hypothetical protein
MPFVILPTNSISGGYDLTNSLRFNSGSSDYLNRTFGSAGNQKTMTISFWIKRSALSSANEIISQGSGSACHITFDSSNQIEMNLRNSVDGGSNVFLITSQLFRDVSAWYHIVLALDTTQATNTNRAKLYVNGTQVTTFGTTTYPSQNGNLFFNEASSMEIGKSVGGTSYYNGYMSDVFFIDGQALTPSSFGETDFDTGIWKPKAYTGTYGTNGFYLQFKNSASLGTDSSGNGNTFTVNNLTSVDQSTDTPTNNFATMNSLSSVSVTLTEGNLKGAGAGDQNFRSTFAVNKGKWYWEVKLGADGGVWGICSENVTMATDRSSNAGVYGIQNAGGSFAYKRENGTTAQSAGFPNPVSGNIMNMAFDADNAKLYIGINGTYYNLSGTTGNPATSSNPTYSSIDTTLLWLAFCEFRGASQSCELNFGNPPYSANSYTDGAGYGNFSYAVPSGYYALNTKNLATFG